jgi:hypothetical protein
VLTVKKYAVSVMCKHLKCVPAVPLTTLPLVLYAGCCSANVEQGDQRLSTCSLVLYAQKVEHAEEQYTTIRV